MVIDHRYASRLCRGGWRPTYAVRATRSGINPPTDLVFAPVIVPGGGAVRFGIACLTTPLDLRIGVYTSVRSGATGIMVPSRLVYRETYAATAQTTKATPVIVVGPRDVLFVALTRVSGSGTIIGYSGQSPLGAAGSTYISCVEYRVVTGWSSAELPDTAPTTAATSGIGRHMVFWRWADD